MTPLGPPDVEGKCNAWYVYGGDYNDIGDGETPLFRCGLPPGHAGLHQDTWTKASNGNDAFLAWVTDERPEIERQEEYDNGSLDGWHCEGEAVPHEPGEAYLEGFVQGVLDCEAYRARAEETTTGGGR